jgi:hypothetical protein
MRSIVTETVQVFGTPVKVTFEAINGAVKILSAKVGPIEETGAVLEDLRKPIAESLVTQFPHYFVIPQ